MAYFGRPGCDPRRYFWHLFVTCLQHFRQSGKCPGDLGKHFLGGGGCGGFSCGVEFPSFWGRLWPASERLTLFSSPDLYNTDSYVIQFNLNPNWPAEVPLRPPWLVSTPFCDFFATNSPRRTTAEASPPGSGCNCAKRFVT